VSRPYAGGSDVKSLSGTSATVAVVDSDYSVTQSLLDQIDSQLGVLHTEVTDLYRVFNSALRDPQDTGENASPRPGYDAPLLRRLASQDDAIRDIRRVIEDLKARSVL